MHQLDLFSSPARFSGPLPAVNAHGVIVLADEVRRWQGSPGYVRAEIRLARYGEEWLWATAYSLPLGGQSGPLAPKWRDQRADSYEEALGAALARLGQQIEHYCAHNPATNATRDLRSWLRAGAPNGDHAGH